MPKITVERSSEAHKNISCFHILVNTNKTIEGGADVDKLQNDLQKLGRHFDEVLMSVYGAPGLDDLSESEIKFVYDTETGNKQKRLHGHIAVQIKHDTKIQVNTKRLKKWALKNGYPVVFSQYTKPDPNENLMNILAKYSRKTYKEK